MQHYGESITVNTSTLLKLCIFSIWYIKAMMQRVVKDFGMHFSENNILIHIKKMNRLADRQIARPRTDG